MSLEFLGWFLISAGITMLIIGIGFWIMELRYKRKVINDAETFIQKHPYAISENPFKGIGREVSELNFRDKSGVLNTIRIIVDHNIEDECTPEDINNMSIDNLMHNHTFSEGSMEKIQQFIFSAQAVRGMREHGLEPDEVVTKMLKASGRMA